MNGSTRSNFYGYMLLLCMLTLMLALALAGRSFGAGPPHTRWARRNDSRGESAAARGAGIRSDDRRR